MFELRPYQIEALDAIDESLKIKQNSLFVGIMGCGKTVIICRLIRAYFRETNRRFLVLVNKTELINQFLETLLKNTDIPRRNIGIACSSFGEKIIDARITIATVQTLTNMKDEYPGADLLIIDECHNYTKEGQYGEIIDYLQQKNSNLRILGCTATPYKLGWGQIFGRACVDPDKNLFDDITHRITYQQLLKLGYLVPLKGKIAHADCLKKDLETVGVQGDFIISQLGEIMSKEIHIKTAADAINMYLSEYKTICVFCTTIAHAEKLKNVINQTEPCTTIHSDLSPIERQINMNDWRSGKIRICTSVQILAEGFDHPPLDCLVFVRPTLSARLYIQAIGRVLRIHPNKNHGFVLDLTDNVSRFGTDIDSVKADVPNKVVEGKKKEDEIWKFCPQCFIEVHKALKICDKCGYEWPAPEIVEAAFVPEMKDVSFEPDPPFVVRPAEIYMTIHQSKNGKQLGKCSFICNRFKFLSVWFCMEDYYNGYAVSAGAKRWKEMGGFDPYPETCEEFERRAENEFVVPMELIVDINGNYPEVKNIIQHEDTGIGLEGEDVPLFEDDCPF